MSRTTQPYRKGARAPSPALAAMLRGKAAPGVPDHRKVRGALSAHVARASRRA